MAVTQASLKALHAKRERNLLWAFQSGKLFWVGHRYYKRTVGVGGDGGGEPWLWTRKALHFGAGNWEYVRTKSIAWRRHRNARAAMGQHRYCRSWIQCARALCRVGIRRAGVAVAIRIVWVCVYEPTDLADGKISVAAFPPTDTNGKPARASPCHAISDFTHPHIGTASQHLKYTSNGFAVHTQLHIYHKVNSTNLTVQTHLLHANWRVTNVLYRRNSPTVFKRLFYDLMETIQQFIHKEKKKSVKPDIYYFQHTPIYLKIYSICELLVKEPWFRIWLCSDLLST
jgi:hypothetical protein